MENRQNTPNLEKCVVLLMMALEFAERGGIFMNCPIVEATAPPPALPKFGKREFGEGAKAVTG